MEFIYSMMETLNAMHNGTLKTLKKSKYFPSKAIANGNVSYRKAYSSFHFLNHWQSAIVNQADTILQTPMDFVFFVFHFFFFIKMPLSDKKEHTTKKIDWQIERMVYTVECVTLFVLRRVNWCDMNQYSKTNDTQAQPGSMNSNPTVKGKSL